MNLPRPTINLTVIVPVLVGLLYAGTGGWSAERWNGALAIMGLGAAGRAGYQSGYFTYNPQLRPGPSRDEHGRFARKEEGQ